MVTTVNRGQIVAVQAAVVAVLAAWSAGAVPLALVAPVALASLTVTLVRVRGRWAYAWLALAIGYALRRRTLPAGAPAEALVELAQPGCEPATLPLDGATVSVVTDAGGPTAIVAVGDCTAVLSDPGPPLPPLVTLLPPAEPGQPAIRLRLVAAVVAAPAPGVAGPAATGYRQLTGGSPPAYRRFLLAVQARRGPGAEEAVLRRVLASAVRRITRRLERSGIPAHPLGPGAMPRVLAELAHDDPAGATVESWSGLAVGGRYQATFHLDGWGGDIDQPPPGAVSLAARLLALPGCAVTLAFAVEGAAADAHLRLAATGPAELAAAVEALQGQLTAAGVAGDRLDGAHLAGLAATLPLGGPAPLAAADAATSPLAGAGAPDLVAGGAGLMLGTNKHDEPVVIRLFRADPTRVVLVGEVTRAQLIVLRALALGASVHLRTGRPGAWEAFLRAVSGPGTAIAVAAPGRGFDAPAAVPLRPQLVILDGGGTAAGTLPLPESPWRTMLVVRDRLGAGDADLLARADLALLAPLSQPEAVLAGAALGLGDTAEWLARIRGDMLGAVVPRRTVRWAMATPTPLERQILGRPPA